MHSRRDGISRTKKIQAKLGQQKQFKKKKPPLNEQRERKKSSSEKKEKRVFKYRVIISKCQNLPKTSRTNSLH